eukprot:9105-Heterococcus_DN1.PRE.2
MQSHLVALTAKLTQLSFERSSGALFSTVIARAGGAALLISSSLISIIATQKSHSLPTAVNMKGQGGGALTRTATIMGMLGVLAAIAGIVVHASIPETVPAAVITAVDSYEGLLATAGRVDDRGTGERFEKEVIMLLHEEGRCDADFAAMNLESFGRLAPDDVTLVSADVNRVDKRTPLNKGQHFHRQLSAAEVGTFLDKFDIGQGELHCPTAVVIKQRSLTSTPRYSKHTAEAGKPLMHAVLQTQAATVGVSNEYDFPVNVFYSWWGSEEALYVRNLQPRKEAWRSTFRTTELIARTMDGQELQRFR